MRKLSTVLAVLVVILTVVSGKLWRDLRAERQLVADLRAVQLVPERPVESAPVVAPAPMPAPAPAPSPEPVRQAATVVNAAPAMTVLAQARELPPGPVMVKPGTAVSTSLPDLRVPMDATVEARRASAFAESESVAMGRVLRWRDRLAQDGHTLTTAQLQALNAAALTELRRETEESLAVDTATTSTDAATIARLREETINRQNETNMRVLNTASPQLTPELIRALRTQFEAGHASRLAAARAERERPASGGN